MEFKQKFATPFSITIMKDDQLVEKTDSRTVAESLGPLIAPPWQGITSVEFKKLFIIPYLENTCNIKRKRIEYLYFTENDKQLEPLDTLTLTEPIIVVFFTKSNSSDSELDEYVDSYSVEDILGLGRAAFVEMFPKNLKIKATKFYMMLEREQGD
eukprot:NODE_484_length_7802_cov_0.227184.p4 type:complete len:155 gc:universal NODE_484_length_7802_cov_0.227184:7331-6867(-)